MFTFVSHDLSSPDYELNKYALEWGMWTTDMSIMEWIG